MAQKRMFNLSVVGTDSFMEMPDSAQNLYFHLSMNADDDGFVDKPKQIMRMTGKKEDDMTLLIVKSFVIPFDSGIIVIKHWKINNYIQKDRYKETMYLEEKSLLEQDENGAYTMCIQPVYKLDTQYSIDKDSIDKDSIDKDSIDKMSNEVKEIIEYLNQKLNTQYKINSKTTQKHISARLNEGFTVDDFKTVIDKKYDEWHGTDMQQYLRPETLFGTKFDSYLNAPKKGRKDNGIARYEQRDYSKEDFSKLYANLGGI